MAKTCAKCGEELTGPILTAEGQTWHPDCFTCDVCNTKLAKDGSISFSKSADGKKMCGECATADQAANAPPARECGKCGKAVTGTTMVGSDGKLICEDCAPTGLCAKCSQPVTYEQLMNGALTMSDGTLFHQGCWSGAVVKSVEGAEQVEEVISEDGCCECGKPLTENSIVAHLGDKFHEECFKCVLCGDVLSGDFVVNPDRKFKYQKARYACQPCAQKDAQAAANGEATGLFCTQLEKSDGEAPKASGAGGGGKACAACGVSLSDGRPAFTTPDGTGMHSECLKCSVCGEVQSLEDPAIKTLFRAKVKQCVEGTLKCAKCAPAQEAMAAPTVDLAKAKLDSEIKHQEMLAQVAEAARLKEEREKAKAEKDIADAAAAAEGEAAKKAAVDAAAADQQAALSAHGAFTLDQLKDESYWKPKGVSEKERETYLSDEEFQTIFGMNKEAFGKDAKWKKDAAKKKHGLF